MSLDNRRWSTRVSLEQSFEYRASSAVFEKGYLINLSYSGARIVMAKRDAEVGPFVEMKIRLDDGETFKLTGVQMWRTPAGSETCVVGIKFDRPCLKARAQLAQAIAGRLWQVA